MLSIQMLSIQTQVFAIVDIFVSIGYEQLYQYASHNSQFRPIVAISSVFEMTSSLILRIYDSISLYNRLNFCPFV
ncbi:MAG: hypothetical protein ACI92E_003133 [Oceanicoccus sp.]|jgi:hypothetical protein